MRDNLEETQSIKKSSDGELSSSELKDWRIEKLIELELSNEMK